NYFQYEAKEAEKWKKMGFGTIHINSGDGIVRGKGGVITLTDDAAKQIIQQNASTHYSFSKGQSKQAYPSSLMGCIALLRQYFYDVTYYENENSQLNISLDAAIKNSQLPAFFHTGDYLNSQRAMKIAQEQHLKFIYVGNGDEYLLVNNNPELL